MNGGSLLRRFFLVVFAVFVGYLLYSVCNRGAAMPLILIVTPTYHRPERLADMTRLSQTLMNVHKLHWIVIENADYISDPVERILKRSGIEHTYLCTNDSNNSTDYFKKGWQQRNMALDFVRHAYREYPGGAVIYFADDGNSYDLRLFDDYIRKVKTIGIWAVGFSGGSLVEAPDVVNGKIKGWLVVWEPTREFAVDMSGFAVNLQLVLNSNTAFNDSCAEEEKTTESCFLEQLNRTKEDLEPFGWDSNPKELLVWRTETTNIGIKGSDLGYVVESF